MTFRRTKSQAGFEFDDLAEFGKALNAKSSKWGPLGQYFDGKDSVVVTRVPGRLDVMGGIADYSGSLVCEGTLGAAAVLGLQPRKDRQVRIHSANAEAEGHSPDFVLELDTLTSRGKPIDYAKARRLLQADAKTAWTAYLAGAFSVLLNESVLDNIPHGANIVLASDIPWGSGISSSAAIEVAALHAINLVYRLGIEPLELAGFAQKVENYIVGAPCGIMDQIITCTGEPGYFLAIRCQPDKVERAVKLPEDWEVVGVNSNVRHSVGGSAYTDVRVATFMGHRIIADLMAEDQVPESERELTRAYLCNLSAKKFKKHYEKRLPSEMLGREFLQAHDDTFDPVTTVDPGTAYHVKSRTGHPVYENERVEAFFACMDHMEEDPDDAHLVEAGRLMYGSHWSYRTRCGLDCTETNFIVRMARNIGIAGGIYGAKITGGGSGANVAILGKRGQLRASVAKIMDLYRKRIDIEPDLFTGSSPGAVDFDHIAFSPPKS